MLALLVDCPLDSGDVLGPVKDIEHGGVEE